MFDLNSTRKLRDGNEMPLFGLGVFQIKDADECVRQVREAIDLGYRHIDTATGYRNEEAVGQGVSESGVDRDKIWVTSKVMPSGFGREETRAAVEESLRKLGFDYLDLYLIHWPVRERTEEAWETLCRLREEGKIRSAGVSNFTVRRFEEQFLPQVAEIPACNQIQRHPFYAQNDVLKFDNERDIFTVAYSPLAQGEHLDDPTLQEIAKSHGKTVAQVMIRWQLELGVGVIPKSSRVERLKENADVFDFQLTPDDLKRIAALDTPDGSVIGWRPEEDWF